MLELIDIKKRYGSKEVLHGISIKFENGIYGLIGPNGSGKSTIMNIMSDVLDMSSGKILYNGTDIKELDDRYREKIGFLPQNVGYYPNFTAKMHMAHPNGRVCGAKRPKCEAERSHHL